VRVFGILMLSAAVGPRALAQETTSTENTQSLTATLNPSVTVAVTGTQGAMIVEASTNFVDWTDVSVLFPNNGQGIFLDTESKNYGLRFFRIRNVVSAKNNTITVNSVHDLRLLTAATGTADMVVRGYGAAGDGGGGQFYWDANSTSPDDGAMSVVPSSGQTTGRWKRANDGAVNVKWFGAVGDGVAIDSPAIRAALEYVAQRGGGKVFLPSGVYKLEASLAGVMEVSNNTLIEGEGASTVILSEGPQAIRNKHTNLPNYGNSNITVQSLTIDCNKRGVNGIVFASVDEGTIHNVNIRDPQGYGVWLFRTGDTVEGEGRPTKRITVSNCHVTGVVDVGIECSGAVGCTIVGNTVTGTRGVAGYYAWNGATDCVFSGNIAEGETKTNRFVGFAVQPSDLITCPVPVSKKTQTQRISFVANIARSVRYGTRVNGTAPNKPTDILIQGNSLYGLGAADRGIEIEQSTRVSVQGNLVDGFQEGMTMNDVQAGFPYDGAAHITIDSNTFKGGDRLLLFGNVGGSLRGNKFFGQRFHSASLFSWKNCTVTDNVFVNLGVDQDTIGIAVLSYNNIPSTGNIFTGNRSMDDRESKWTSGTITFSGGAHDCNIATGNSAVGAKTGARAVWNFSSGTKNVVANNIDG